MPRKLNDRGVAALEPREARYAVPDPELVGHFIRVQPTGAKSFVAVTRDPRGRQIWTTIGKATVYTIEEARDRARSIIKSTRTGEAPPESFQAVAENWLTRYVQAKSLRTAPEIERCLRKYVFPSWAEREFTEIKRSDVAALLDTIEDRHGARQADRVLSMVRKLMNWAASRSDAYTSPIIPGMRRQDPKQQERARILDDDELRAVWRQAEAAGGAFGATVQLLLLTAQRREKVAAMRWRDISDDGEWTIPTEPREKGNAGSLMLPAIALEIIRTQPRFASNAFVFAGRGAGHFNGYSKSKVAFDAKLAQRRKTTGEKVATPLPDWTLHDLRRTARSLMARAGVRPDIAERVLGHAIGGVEGVYDRHSYREEKAAALVALAELIQVIVRNDA